MNYEQKYNEVLQKAKEEYNRLGELGNESMKRRFEIIFPELRESEDERIRKRLVEYFNGFYDGFSSGNNVNVRWEGLEVKKVIAYLEKQKEQKPDLELIQRSWYMDGYIDGEFKREPRWNLKAGKGGPKYEENEKYGQPLEQKEWSDEDLPKWKKTKPERGKAFGAGPWYPSGLMHDNGKHIVFFRGYEISVDELFDKLPKED